MNNIHLFVFGLLCFNFGLTLSKTLLKAKFIIDNTENEILIKRTKNNFLAELFYYTFCYFSLIYFFLKYC